MAEQNPHISLFVPTLEGGGAERIMVMIANGLAEAGEKVDLVVGNAGGPNRILVADGVNLVDLDSARMLTAAPKFARYLYRRRPQSVMSAIGHTNIATALLARLFSPRTRVVLSIHNSMAASAHAGLRGRIFLRMERWALKRADHTVTVSDGIRSQLVTLWGLDPAMVTTILNPLEVDKLAEMSASPAGHPWLDDPEAPVIIGVGRLVPVKDFETLIRAFALVVDKQEARLVILGEGEELPRLESLVASLGLEEVVSFPGFVSNVPAYLGKASVFVLSSLSEGLPGVLLEALACNTQVVSTDCETGPREILEDGKWGRLVAVGDHEAMAEAIRQTLSRPEPIPTRRRAADFESGIAMEKYRRVLTADGG